MTRLNRCLSAGIALGAAAILWCAPLQAQTPSLLRVTPSHVTLLVGQSASFRLVDETGQMQTRVGWHLSAPDAFDAEDGDEISLTAKKPGDYTLAARASAGSAEASVAVMRGNSLPVGTTTWSTGDAPGCKTTHLTQAMPSADGPDFYVQSDCADGQYVAAYREGGIQLWRRKLGEVNASLSAAPKPDAPPAARLRARSQSVCDWVSVGDNQARIRDLLHQQNLAFREGPAAERVWTIDEPNTQCKLWFDERFVLTKKRKVFVAE
jgi:hypothetical protein